ncbi:MAG: hypothetical protein MK066_01380 [Crocinitomicaceae bacterium]|nr:hypothetical protein [Crocinitomicaceae bacterium]
MKSLKLISFIIALLVSLSTFSQKGEKFKLSDKLREISGLELLNDSTFVALNDGGNKAELFLLNLKGKIIKKIEVEGVSNKDWEDLASDKKYIYISDLGNNLNSRKKLAIYKVKKSDLLKKKSVNASKISLKYKDQKDFPPKEKKRFYDCEAIAVYNDSIWIFTKNRSKPSTGTTRVYKCPKKPGKYTLKKDHEVYIGKGGFWKDVITAADIYKDKFYLMTYNRLIIMTLKNGHLIKEKTVPFGLLTQKESLVVKSANEIYIADEVQKILGGGKLYKINPNK